MTVSKKQFAVNAVWKIMEQFSAKGIAMIVSIVLARLLSPSDYGLLALTAVFTNLSDILIDGGFSTTLIRKENVDDYDYSAVFSVSSSISVLLYIILFFVAPSVANYYKSPQLIAVLRVIGLTFFIQSFTAVRNGIVNRNMQFKLLFLCNTTASIVSGVVGIASAYAGLGVWSLVIQRLTQQTFLTIMLFIKVRWTVKWKFDFARIKEMLSFSIGVVGASLLYYLGGNIYSAAIGKKYSVTELGYYDKGNQLPMQFSLYTFGAMSNVLLPTISSCQSDFDRVKRIIRKVVGMTSFLIMPMMVGLALTSREMITLLFTDKWLSSVPVMQCACLYYIATPYLLINVQVFFALGHSELRVKTEIIRLSLMAIGLGVFGFGFKCSMNQLALIGAIIAVVVLFISYYEVYKLIGYRLNEVVTDMWKSTIGSLFMGGGLILINSLIDVESAFFLLVIKVVVGVTVYAIFAFVLKMQERNDVIELLRRRKNNE